MRPRRLQPEHVEQEPPAGEPVGAVIEIRPIFAPDRLQQEAQAHKHHTDAQARRRQLSLQAGHIRARLRRPAAPHRTIYSPRTQKFVALLGVCVHHLGHDPHAGMERRAGKRRRRDVAIALYHVLSSRAPTQEAAMTYHYALPEHVETVIEMFDAEEVVLVGHVDSTIDALPDEVLGRCHRRQFLDASRRVILRGQSY